MTTCQGIGASIWWPNKESEVKQTFEFSEEIKTFEVNRNFYIEVGKSEQ